MIDILLVDEQVLSRIVDRSSQTAGRTDWGFDAWMAKEDGCVGVEESMVASRGLGGNPASCCYDWSLGETRSTLLRRDFVRARQHELIKVDLRPLVG